MAQAPTGAPIQAIDPALAQSFFEPPPFLPTRTEPPSFASFRNVFQTPPHMSAPLPPPPEMSTPLFSQPVLVNQSPPPMFHQDAWHPVESQSLDIPPPLSAPAHEVHEEPPQFMPNPVHTPPQQFVPIPMHAPPPQFVRVVCKDGAQSRVGPAMDSNP